MKTEALKWLKVAKSNLKLGRVDIEAKDSEIRFEELCFELQQCCEKSLKALLIFNDISFPKTHNISELLKLLKSNLVDVPENILKSAIVTQYAVNTRYPVDYIEVTKEDYQETLQIAENIYNWVEGQIN